jgi:hypothetical protein
MASPNPAMFSWQQPLAALFGGLSAAGQPGGFANFGMGVNQALQQQQGAAQAQQMAELRDMQIQQQQQEMARANKEAADREATGRQLAAMVTGQMPVKSVGNYGAATGGVQTGQPAMFKNWSPEQRAVFAQFAQSNPAAAQQFVVEQQFAQPTYRAPINIAGKLYDPNDPTKLVADHSADEIALAQAKRDITRVDVDLPAVETEFQKTLGKTQGEQAAAIAPAANKARMAMDQYTALEQAVAGMKAAGSDPGRLAGMANELAASAQAFGIDPASLGLPANAGPYEQALAISNKLALANIGSDNGGLPANNFTEADRNFIMQIAPQITNTEQGLAAKIDMGRRVNKRNLDAEELWNSGRYQQTQEGFSQYQKDWAAYVRANPLYTPEELARVKALATGSDAGGGWQEINGVRIRQKPNG